MARRGGLGVFALIGLGAGLAVAAQKAIPKIKEFWEDNADDYKRLYCEKVDPLVSKAKVTVTPYVTKAKETVTPYVEKARETVTPYVDKAKEAVAPYVDMAKDAVNKFVGRDEYDVGCSDSCCCEEDTCEAAGTEDAPGEVSDEEFRQSEAPAE